MVVVVAFCSCCTETDNEIHIDRRREEEKEKKEKPYLHCCVLLCESSASGEMEAQKLYCGWLKRLVYLSSPSHMECGFRWVNDVDVDSLRIRSLCTYLLELIIVEELGRNDEYD